MYRKLGFIMTPFQRVLLESPLPCPPNTPSFSHPSTPIASFLLSCHTVLLSAPLPQQLSLLSCSAGLCSLHIYIEKIRSATKK